MSPFNAFDTFMFSFGPIFMVIIFLMVVGGFVFVIFNGIRTWSHNNAQPVLTVWAKVVSKRTSVSSHVHNDNGTHHHSSSTFYYVTFEVESGDRMELAVTGQEYGMLVEGDTGKLTFQGTRYKGFTRER
ncbi:DUF2500 domain-containing protein [Clostridium swellfunianum]|uniref:DUF2500 domain-containing protein n=1 Tax=Clostridium swellfunianum TaxID=1367462 RepID=UPI002030A10F|nr:DUF2500 domain-containing protein [Clostridium swellfunianum]MCM0649165.1 DUF2500 domain-containing protein [Clostridium swellfunianum]